MAIYHAGTSPCLFTDYELHDHEYYEVILNLAGEGTAVMGNKEYPFVPGTIHIVPPNTLHTKRSEKGFRDIYFHTDTLEPEKNVFRKEILHSEPIILHDDAEHTLEKSMQIILSRYLQFKKDDRILDSMYHVALYFINEWLDKVPSDPVVDKVTAQILGSFSDPEFVVTDALLATGYSKDYMRRRFIADTGMTPNDYLTSLRIQYAKKLLNNKEQLRMSISEISLASGYYDVHYFSRIFRKHTGMSPGKYAKDASAIKEAGKP